MGCIDITDFIVDIAVDDKDFFDVDGIACDIDVTIYFGKKSMWRIAFAPDIFAGFKEDLFAIGRLNILSYQVFSRYALCRTDNFAKGLAFLDAND